MRFNRVMQIAWFLLASVAAVAALCGIVPASNQAIDINTLIANQSGNFTWLSAAPTSAPSGHSQLVTYSYYKTIVANATPAACTNLGLAANQVMNWNAVIACAASHSATQQSESVSGNYSTQTYTASFNSTTGLYTCHGPFGANTYTGTPITLPAGTIAPGSSTPLTLSLTVAYPGTSTSLTVSLQNPSGSTVNTWTVNAPSTSLTASWSTAGAAGSWSWVITQTGGTTGSCDSSSGAGGGGTQVSWSGTATWYQ